MWLALLLLLLVACDDSPLASQLDASVVLARPDATLPSSAELEGRQYVLQTATGYRPRKSQDVRLRFVRGQARWSAGCNEAFGPYAITDGALTISMPVQQLKYCNEDVHVEEAWLLTFFSTRPRITVAGDWLTLVGSEGTLDYLAPSF